MTGRSLCCMAAVSAVAPCLASPFASSFSCFYNNWELQVCDYKYWVCSVFNRIGINIVNIIIVFVTIYSNLIWNILNLTIRSIFKTAFFLCIAFHEPFLFIIITEMKLNWEVDVDRSLVSRVYRRTKTTLSPIRMFSSVSTQPRGLRVKLCLVYIVSNILVQ